MSIDDLDDGEFREDWNSEDWNTDDAADDNTNKRLDEQNEDADIRRGKIEKTWKGAVVASIAGIILIGISTVIVGLGKNHILIPISTGVGTIVLAGGIYGILLAYRWESRRRHEELVQAVQQGHAELSQAIQRIGGNQNQSVLGTRAETLLNALRQQRKLTQQLLDDLPDQRQDMSLLIDELTKRNQVIEELFENDVGESRMRTNSNKESEKADANPSNNKSEIKSKEESQSEN